MKLILYDGDNNTEISFLAEEPIILCCENKNYFSKLVACAKGVSEKEFAIFENDEKIYFEKNVLTIIDYYGLENDLKTVVAKWYKALEKKHVGREETEYFFARSGEEIDFFLKELLSGYNASFDYEIPHTVGEYLKLVSLKPHYEQTDIFNGLLNFIEIIADLRLYKVFVMVNMQSFFTQKQAEEIVKKCAYYHQPLLCIEQDYQKDIIVGAKKILIEEDFFDIILS